MNIFGKLSNLPFSRNSDRKKEKSMVSFRHEQILFAAKQSRATLCVSRPLFVGSYLQIMWWALGQWKGRKFCNEWWFQFCFVLFSLCRLLLWRYFTRAWWTLVPRPLHSRMQVRWWQNPLYADRVSGTQLQQPDQETMEMLPRMSSGRRWETWAIISEHLP